MRIKINITDDHLMVINGLRYMLSLCPAFEVTAHYTRGEDLLAGLAINTPDILLMDIQMPGLSGSELAATVSKKYPGIGIIAVTNINIFFQISDMLKNGCRGYLLKDAELPKLEEAIKTVHAGNVYIDSNLGIDTLSELQKIKRQTIRLLPTLTKREKETLGLITKGMSNPEIAEKLCLSLRTVESHRFNLMKKMEAKNLAELINKALHSGIL